MAHENFKRVDRELKKWLADRPSAEKQITALKEQAHAAENRSTANTA